MGICTKIGNTAGPRLARLDATLTPLGEGVWPDPRSDTETGHRIVRHEPNLSSGGRVTETPVEEWLDRTGAGPENAALRSLLERSDAAGRTK
jgi:hypothetical protein